MAPLPPAQGLLAAWSGFWFRDADPIGLHVLRVLAGLLFIAWLLPFAGNVDAFFGLNGWFDARAYREASHLADSPANLFGWSVLYLCGANTVLVKLVYWLALGVFVLFTLGVATRVTAALTWVLVASFSANPATAFDADPFLGMLAFYLMLGYLLYDLRKPRQSFGAILLGSTETLLFRRTVPATPEHASASAAANLAVRLIQVHFSIAMVASGLHKLQVKEWWSGAAAWFLLYQPFHVSMDEVRSSAAFAETYLTFLSLTSYVVLAWQLAFPTFAWRPRWRPLLLGGAVLAWLADALLLRLPLFGPIMMIGCLSYLSPSEWRRVGRFLGKAPGLQRLVGRLSRVPEGRPGREAKRGVELARVSVSL
jgi:hypothetical protein